MFILKNVKYMNIIEIDDLIIESNKITCIIGESGSGKTTLIRLLNNLLSCDRGEILFNGVNINTIDPVSLRRSVVMLPQNPTIFPGTIKYNLLIGLKFAEKPVVDDKKLRDILNFVKLDKDLLDDVDHLSGGEKQRLALARIILIDPDVFLLDEPSSSLDEETENLIINKIVTYTKENHKTLIMVTHSKKIASNYSDVIIQIHYGKVLN